MLNTAEITLNGTSYTLRASNWARQLYAEEFDGKLREPWNGRLDHDVAQMLAATVGEYVGDGSVRLNEPPEQMWGIVWALAAAGGSISESYPKWWARCIRDELTPIEERAEVASEVLDLAMRSFFRESEKREGQLDS